MLERFRRSRSGANPRRGARMSTTSENDVKRKAILLCDTCTDLADRSLESDSKHVDSAVSEFLTHLIHNHSDEVMMLITDKYIPTLMSKRALR